MNRQLFLSGIIAFTISCATIGIFTTFQKTGKKVTIEHIQNTPSQSISGFQEEVPIDFNSTAEKVLEGVVHIKSTQLYSQINNPQMKAMPHPFGDLFGNDFKYFFGPGLQENPNKEFKRKQRNPGRVGTGSGVIISSDGYIVTNNHVIADADDIEVTLHDNQSYKATVVGTDPSTDLALLQIRAKDLPTVSLTDSDDVRIGQWVLAVGNPMGLNSTVTAGIISAKGRNINLLREQYAVEDFIQTDAAINPGNSGGALVNLSGGLVGINTAIASPTGTFAGYGFAIPTNIVSKVVDDLIQYGMVQRGVLGIMIKSVDSNFAKEKDLDTNQGAYVDSLLDNSAAAKAGIQVGDVIQSVNDQNVNNSAQLQGLIARYRPGENVSVKVLRDGKEKIFDVVLNNTEGNTEFMNKDTKKIFKILGAEFEDLDKSTMKKLDIQGGIKVKKLYPGKLRRQTQIREGFIITLVDGVRVKNIEELSAELEKKTGGVMLTGMYEDIPGEYYYAFGLK